MISKKQIKIIYLFLYIFSTNFLYSAINEQELKNILIKPDNTISYAAFTPKDSVRQLLIALINSEKKSIRVAIYMLTDNYIAQALKKAKLERNINIEIISEKTTANGQFSKIPLLSNLGIKTYIYNFPHPEHGIMHNKFFIFEKNINNKSILWTGSFNCTNSAQVYNQENIIILDDTNLINIFENQFNYLKNNSIFFSSSQKINWFNKICFELTKSFKRIL